MNSEISRLRLLFLGSPLVELDGIPVKMDNRRAVALLSYLAVSRGKHRRDSLINLFWPDYDQSRARTLLRRNLYVLNKALTGDWLEADSETISLNPNTPIWLDVERFHSLLEGCKSHGHPHSEVCPSCLKPLTEGAELYRDDFLSGFGIKDSFNFDDWQFFQTQRLRQELEDTLEKLVKGISSLAEFKQAIVHGQRWLSLDRLNERAHYQLMELYAWDGQISSALKQYEEHENILREKTGQSPSESITQFYLAIKEGRIPDPPSQESQTFPLQVSSQSWRESEGALTVFYLDMKDSPVSDQSEGEGNLRDQYLKVIENILSRFGGKIDRIVENEVVGMFRSEEGSGRDAENAIKAALEIRSELEKLGLNVSAGVDTEEAYAGKMALSDKGEFVIGGKTANLAKELGGKGERGSIIAGEGAHRRARDSFEFTPLALERKGIDFPFEGYRVESVLPPIEGAKEAESSEIRAPEEGEHNLPIPPTQLIGRERELSEIRELVLDRDVRLLTLSGTGGTGKTRLGLQVALDFVGSFKDGVNFVDLSPIRDFDLVFSTIFHALGLQETGEESVFELLKSFLGDKEKLIFLDNFEQVIEAAPRLTELISACPKLKVLVTSREDLKVRGEQVFPVPPLRLQELSEGEEHLLSTLMDNEAIRFFVERAKSVKPQFVVTEGNIKAIAEICVRLDGLPLALELAAARVKLLSPQGISSRLSGEHGYTPMSLLTDGARDLPGRHKTLRDTIEWSYDLLDESEKKLFIRLSVFSGGYTLESAEEVCNFERDLDIDILDGLTSLVYKNLLLQEEAFSKKEVDEDPRFGMLETIGEYATERLQESGEEDEVRRLHLEYYLALAEEAETEFHGPDQLEWIGRLEQEHDNLRAAMEWSLANGKPEAGLELAGALGWFWYMNGYSREVSEWFKKGLSVNNNIKPILRAKCQGWAAILAVFLGDDVQAAKLYQEGLSLLQDIEDKLPKAELFYFLGAAAYFGGFENSNELFEESLTLFRDVGESWGIAYSLRGLGLALSNYERAVELFKESLEISREMGDRIGIAFVLRNWGLNALYQGDYEQALPLFEESLVFCQELKDRWSIAYILEGLGMVHALGNEKPERAAKILGAAEALREEIGNPIPTSERSLYEKSIDMLRDGLSEGAFEAAWAEGRAMKIEETIEYALSVEKM